MRAAIHQLAALGPLPATDAAEVDQLEQYQQLLTGLQPPVSDPEAQVLTGLFPQTWTTAMGWPGRWCT